MNSSRDRARYRSFPTATLTESRHPRDKPARVPPTSKTSCPRLSVSSLYLRYIYIFLKASEPASALEVIWRGHRISNLRTVPWRRGTGCLSRDIVSPRLSPPTDRSLSSTQIGFQAPLCSKRSSIRVSRAVISTPGFACRSFVEMERIENI